MKDEFDLPQDTLDAIQEGQEDYLEKMKDTVLDAIQTEIEDFQGEDDDVYVPTITVKPTQSDKNINSKKRISISNKFPLKK